jgi:hypothetical protein
MAVVREASGGAEQLGYPERGFSPASELRMRANSPVPGL